MKIQASTIIVIIMVFIIGGYNIYLHERNANHPPIVERALETSSNVGITPVPEFIIRKHDELKLSAEQMKMMNTIAASYSKVVTPYKQKIRDESLKYEKKMKELRKKNASVEEIKNAYGEIGLLSSIISTTRQSYWQQARGVLSASQQKQLDVLIKKVEISDLQ